MDSKLRQRFYNAQNGQKIMIETAIKHIENYMEDISIDNQMHDKLSELRRRLLRILNRNQDMKQIMDFNEWE